MRKFTNYTSVRRRRDEARYKRWANMDMTRRDYKVVKGFTLFDNQFRARKPSDKSKDVKKSTFTPGQWYYDYGTPRDATIQLLAHGYLEPGKSRRPQFNGE